MLEISNIKDLKLDRDCDYCDAGEDAPPSLYVKRKVDGECPIVDACSSSKSQCLSALQNAPFQVCRTFLYKY